jgi:septum formation protein
MMNQRIILGSSSPSRIAILEQLGLPFERMSPDIDESQHLGEIPSQMVQRLALEKAQAVALHYPDALIIGSDQVAQIDGEVAGKPHTHENALKQLMAASGKVIEYHNGLCLLNAKTGRSHIKLNTVRVHFRPFSWEQADLYLKTDQPYACAGSLKIEGRGITLIERIESKDPYSLVGLPLIDLVDMLTQEGVNVLEYCQWFPPASPRCVSKA